MLNQELQNLLSQALRHYLPKPLVIDPSVLAYRYTSEGLQALDVQLSIGLDDLLGIDQQKARLVANTEQFLHNLPANHVLMTGTRGAGKSSLIKALLNHFYKDGLRVIEMARDELVHLDKVRHAIQDANSTHKYIMFCDDLAFNTQDENYRTLKSILDGAMDSSLDNLLIYATSNRRHLLPQLMKDNVSIYNGQTDEINPYETIDETVSLSDRFGLWLSFHPMTQSVYLDIARHYLAQAKIDWTPQAQADALRFASERGGRSGRVAYQFSRHFVGQHQLQQLKTHFDGA